MNLNRDTSNLSVAMMLVLFASFLSSSVVRGQESNHSDEPSDALRVLEKGSIDGGIGFFADGEAVDIRTEGLPDDPIFDRYVPLAELADAWEGMESEKLADLAIQASEGERILRRGRRGISTASLWQIAIHAAEVQHKAGLLDRLAAAAERYEMTEVRDRLKAAVVLAGESRAAEETTTVNPFDVSVEDFAMLQDYSRCIQGAAVRGDSRFLQDIQHNVDNMFPDAPELRKIIEALLNRPSSKPSLTPLEPNIVGAMDQLLADSRIGFPKLPKNPISIKPPKLPIPDPAKAAREAAERARKAAETEANRAAEFARQRAEAARKAAEAEARQAAEFARQRAEAARKAAETEAQRVADSVKDAGRDLDRDRLKAIEYFRRYSLPVIRQYIAYLDSQASNRYHGLPQNLQQILARHFPGVDLGRVRYAESINTIHGQGITIGDNIYFPVNVDFEKSKLDFEWLLHELEHVSQYRVHGGVEPFLIKYLVNGGIQIGAKGSFDIHDDINLERDAEHKAERISDALWEAWESALNGFNLSVNGSSIVDPLAGTWKTDGRTVSFSNGVCTIQTPNGSASFRYSYDPRSGILIGIDRNGVQSETRVKWLSQNSFEWNSSSGRRHYARAQ